MNAAAALRQWQLEVSAQLKDPDHPPFIASARTVVVIGGHHTEMDYCWCQPRMELHGCGHRHGEHRRVMD